MGLTGLKFDAMFVQQERVFQGATREQALGQAGEEDRIEGAAAGFIDGSDEDMAVAAPRRIGAERAHFFRKHIVDFFKRGWAHFAHRFQFAQDREHGFGITQGHLGQLGQASEPFAPLRCFRE